MDDLNQNQPLKLLEVELTTLILFLYESISISSSSSIGSISPMEIASWVNKKKTCTTWSSKVRSNNYKSSKIL